MRSTVISTPLMRSELDAVVTAAQKLETLEEVINVELGDPAQNSSQPVSAAQREWLQLALDDVERAHAAAAARLHTLYAD